MKSIIMLLILNISLNVTHAKTIRSQVHSFETGKNQEAHLVKLTNGQVVFINANKKALLTHIKKSAKTQDWIKLTVDKYHDLKAFHIIPAPFAEKPLMSYSTSDPYKASVISLTKAKSIFRKMRGRYQKKSQCFNRAHIWTYDEYRRSGTNLNKLFLFFTSSYIRRYNYHWWFHVTPMAHVGGSKMSNWKILDRRYTKDPTSLKPWTNIFIKSKRSCKVASQYSEYDQNQNTQHCFVIPMSQYYLVPSDLDRLERMGIEKTAYDELEVEHALWEAF